MASDFGGDEEVPEFNPDDEVSLDDSSEDESDDISLDDKDVYGFMVDNGSLND